MSERGTGVVLAAGVHGQDPAIFVLLTLAAVLTAVVAGVAIAAYVRRRSRRYLLVALALSTLVARSAVGLWAYTGRIGPGLHHQLEHGLDVAMAALVIAAVYLVGKPAYSGTARADGGSVDDGESVDEGGNVDDGATEDDETRGEGKR